MSYFSLGLSLRISQGLKNLELLKTNPKGPSSKVYRWGLASVAEDAPSGCYVHALEGYLGPTRSTHIRTIPQALASHTVSEITHLTWATQPVLLDAVLKLTGISWMK